MAIPTVESIFVGVRSALGDDQDPGGQIFTDDMQRGHLSKAFEDLMAELLSLGVPYVEKEAYYNLPAYTNRLTPAQVGISDFGEPILVEERGGLTKVTVTAATAATPIVVTAAGHGLATNQEVVITGVGPEVNGRWFITLDPADPTNKFSLNGSVGSLAYSGVTGAVSTTTEKFTEVRPVDRIGQQDPLDSLIEYNWENDTFLFRGATGERQLRIEYTSNGSLPETGSLGIDGCGNYLISATAARAAASRDMPKQAANQASDADRALFKFLQAQVKSMQRIRWRPLPFRRRRNRPF